MFQDMLQTGGINTNMFKARRREYMDPSIEEVTIAVNDRQTAETVADFFSQHRPLITKISLGSANDKNVVEVIMKEDPKVAQVLDPKKTLGQKRKEKVKSSRQKKGKKNEL